MYKFYLNMYCINSCMCRGLVNKNIVFSKKNNYLNMRCIMHVRGLINKKIIIVKKNNYSCSITSTPINWRHCYQKAEFKVLLVFMRVYSILNLNKCTPITRLVLSNSPPRFVILWKHILLNFIKNNIRPV